MSRHNCRPFGFLLAGGAALLFCGLGCDSTPNGLPIDQNPDNSKPGAVNLTFNLATENQTVRDNVTMVIPFHVTTDHAVTVRTFLDEDSVAGNGNEVEIGSSQDFQAPGADGTAELVAGRYRYGTYFVRGRVEDSAGPHDFTMFGLLNIIPLVGPTSISNDPGIESLNGLKGMRLLHTTGSPGPVNSRIPFMATWSYPDFADQLSPVLVAPFETNQTIEVHYAQFYIFGHSTIEPKNIQLYRNTNEQSVGDQILAKQFDMPSFPTGGWNLVPIDPPLVLEPGKYGISYHGEFEFSDNWAGNAPSGTGYAWMTPFIDLPFDKATKTDLDFTPNFTFRLIGKLIPEQSTPVPNGRLIIPIPLDPVYPDNGSKPPEGLGDKNGPDVDSIGGASPYHITWQIAR